MMESSVTEYRITQTEVCITVRHCTGRHISRNFDRKEESVDVMREKGNQLHLQSKETKKTDQTNYQAQAQEASGLRGSGDH